MNYWERKGGEGEVSFPFEFIQWQLSRRSVVDCLQ